MNKSFKALLLEKDHQQTPPSIQWLTQTDLPQEDVLIQVDYSSLNYKDSMALTGSGKIILQWPMVPGIDCAGQVLESNNSAYKAGDSVILTGWGVGEKYWGGYSQQQRVKAEWLTPLPQGLNTQQAMSIGTAGLTAMLCVMAIQEGGATPEQGPVAVTGASGGVGSIAVALLAHAGYQVHAITGDNANHDYLTDLGAQHILSRETMSEPSRPLEKQQWAAAIDTVGGNMLARLLAETEYNGTIAACGLAGSIQLPTTVMPFILRNVRLQGVDSVVCPAERRTHAWQRLANELPHQKIEAITQLITLEDLTEHAQMMMRGKTKGRIVVDLSD